MKTLLTLLILMMATCAMAQSNAPVELIVDANGVPFPSGTGVSPPQSSAPEFTCVTKIAGVLQYCNLSGSGGSINPEEIGGVFQASGFPSSCTVNSVAYTTQIECAFATASLALTTAGNQNVTLEVGPGFYRTCGALQFPNPSSNAALSIVASGYSGTSQNGVTIQQSSSGGCNTSLPVIYQAASPAGNTALEQEIKGITIDGNNLVPCMQVNGTRRSEYDVTCNNPGGTYGFTINGTGSNTGFEIRKSRLLVRTAAVSGITYPTFTTTLTGGAVSAWNVTAGGSFPLGTSLVASVYTQGCTTPPTAPTIQTSTTSTITVTGLTTTGSAGVGCTRVDVQVYEAPTITHGIIINSTDSTYSDLVVAGPTIGSAIQVNGGNNLFIHAHAFAHQPVMIEDHGQNVYDFVECDSVGGTCFQYLGSHTQVHGMTSYWNANVYAGSSDIFVQGGIANALFGHTCNGTQSAGGYVEISTPSGPIIPHAGTAPAGLEVTGINEVCDGSGLGDNYWGEFLNGPLSMSAAGNILNLCTSATSSQNCTVLAGNGRIEFGFDSVLSAGFLGGQSGKSAYILSNGVRVAGWDIGGTPYHNVGTTIAAGAGATIAPLGGVVHIADTTAISTITPPPTRCQNSGYSCQIILIPDVAFTTLTTGNIAIPSNAVIGKAMVMVYDPATVKWYPSY